MRDEHELSKKAVKTVDSSKIVIVKCPVCGVYLDPDTMYCEACDTDYYEE